MHIFIIATQQGKNERNKNTQNPQTFVSKTDMLNQSILPDHTIGLTDHLLMESTKDRRPGGEPNPLAQLCPNPGVKSTRPSVHT